MKTKNKAERSFECKCKRRYVFPAYVHAHWNEVLIFTCPTCGTKYKTRRGRAVEIVEEKP
jgi:Zn finger protein HypA/HybF involved in hydrogenase expression